MSKMKNTFILAAAFCLLGYTTTANAGVDIAAPVQRVQIAADGKIWFSMDTVTNLPTWCKTGWNNMSLYIPKENPEYPYYYATLITALTKNKNVFLGNISYFNGSTSCDITQTGFGLTLVQ